MKKASNPKQIYKPQQNYRNITDTRNGLKRVMKRRNTR